MRVTKTHERAQVFLLAGYRLILEDGPEITTKEAKWEDRDEDTKVAANPHDISRTILQSIRQQRDVRDCIVAASDLSGTDAIVRAVAVYPFASISTSDGGRNHRGKG
jgi:hypothetical protein